MKQYSAVPRMGVVCDNNFILSGTTAILLQAYVRADLHFSHFCMCRDEQVRFYVCWGTDHIHSSPGSDAGTAISSPLTEIATQLGGCTANWYDEQSQAPDNYFASLE